MSSRRAHSSSLTLSSLTLLTWASGSRHVLKSVTLPYKQGADSLKSTTQKNKSEPVGEPDESHKHIPVSLLIKKFLGAYPEQVEHHTEQRTRSSKQDLLMCRSQTKWLFEVNDRSLSSLYFPLSALLLLKGVQGSSWNMLTFSKE